MPLVSVLLAVHDGGRYLEPALDSVLRQTARDLELIVVDDASTDGALEESSAAQDERVTVLQNDEQLGLAASLNRGLDHASGRYVARLDADDLALPRRLELQLDRLRSHPDVAIVGSDIADLDEAGRTGAVHETPRGAVAVRWHALFSSPFFHPSVVVDRELLDRHGLRYDHTFLESEDYDLWTRLLALCDGDNVPVPLVLKRAHALQASRRRRELQMAFQLQVALREIARVAPDVSTEDAEAAWELGSGRNPSLAGVDAYVRLLERFEAEHGVDRGVRGEAARALARAGAFGRALRLAPHLPVAVPFARARRRVRAREVRRPATASTRVTFVSPEPTPYRAPLLDLVAERPELELTVVYAAPTVAGRTWQVESSHRGVVLEGVRVPGVRGLFRHDYPVTPGIRGALGDADPDVVVVSGWSTFAAQAAIGWCRARRVPYVLLVESHDLDPRAGWRRAVKHAVVPPVVRGAASVLAVGSAARDSVIARGAAPERVRIFANTIDVPAWIEAVDSRRVETEDFVVLSVGRLAPEKGFDTLIRAVSEVARASLVIAGEGALRHELTRLAERSGARLTLLGDLPPDRLLEAYAAADVFALLSHHEPWGVVVNEAAASALPLVLSDRVGAAYDLLEDGENGFVVPAGEPAAAAAALRRLANDADLRRRMGERSRERVRAWGYEPSVENFVAAVREAIAR